MSAAEQPYWPEDGSGDAWYVAVDEQAVGPVSTALVCRGLESGRVPVDAHICAVGAAAWVRISDVPRFEDAVRRSSLPPLSPPSGLRPRSEPSHAVPEDEPATPSRPNPFAAALAVAPISISAGPISSVPSAGGGSHLSIPLAPAVPAELLPLLQDEGSLPSFELEPYEPAGFEGLRALEAPVSEPEIRSVPSALLEPVLERGAAGDDEADELEIVVDLEEDGGLQLGAPLCHWALPLSNFRLPNEVRLLSALDRASDEELLESAVLWNVALCLGFGSEKLGSRFARRVLGTIERSRRVEALETLLRSLLDRGFVRSGMPSWARERGVAALDEACPPALRAAFDALVR